MPQSHWWPQKGLFCDTAPEPFDGNTSVTVYKPLAALTDSYFMNLTQVFTGSSGFQSDILKAFLHADLSRFSIGPPYTFSNSPKCSDGWSWGLLPAAGDWKQAHLGDIIQLSAGARCLPCPCPAHPPCAVNPAREQCCRWYPVLSSSGGKHCLHQSTNVLVWEAVTPVWSLSPPGLAKTLPGDGCAGTCSALLASPALQLQQSYTLLCAWKPRPKMSGGNCSSVNTLLYTRRHP